MIKRILFFSICISIGVYKIRAQDLKYRLQYEEKTSRVDTPFDSSLSFTSLYVYPSFVEYRLYINDTAITDVCKNGFASRLKDIERFYIKYPRDKGKNYKEEKRVLQNTQTICGYMNFKLRKKINRKIRAFKPAITSADSVLIALELFKLRRLFKDSAIKNYYVSDSLFNVLKKYPGDHQLLVDIPFLQTNYFLANHFNYFSLIKYYVVDMKTKRVLFYNYKMDCGGMSYKLFDKSEVPTKRINSLIYGYIEFVKQNKRYLKNKVSR